MLHEHYYLYQDFHSTLWSPIVQFFQFPPPSFYLLFLYTFWVFTPLTRNIISWGLLEYWLEEQNSPCQINIPSHLSITHCWIAFCWNVEPISNKENPLDAFCLGYSKCRIWVYMQTDLRICFCYKEIYQTTYIL